MINIAIDEKEVKVLAEDKNIVDIAKRVQIKIPAPCYTANRKNGCCKACVVEINGDHQYACSTKPQVGMIIITDREDLNLLRKKRISDYRKNIPTEAPGCSCAESSACCKEEPSSLKMRHNFKQAPVKNNKK